MLTASKPGEVAAAAARTGEDRGDGDALDLGSSLADAPSEIAAEPEPSADDVLWHERCRAEWSGMPEIEARTGWEQVYTDAALHQTIFGDGESAVAHPFVLLNVGRADLSSHPLMTDAALARPSTPARRFGRSTSRAAR